MVRKGSLVVGAALAGVCAVASSPAYASHAQGAQICSVGAAAVGQPGTLICKDTASGATTQSIVEWVRENVGSVRE